MGNGPKSWSAAKKRQKRPQSTLARATAEQNLGRLPRQTVSRPDAPQKTILKSKKAPLKSNEKRLRSLNKLLREIEALQQREADGEDLDEQQQTKLDRLDDVLSEMETLMSGG